MFDLSMQSALDIFCYVLVLIYGLALSADISTGGHVSRQQKCLLTLLCLLFLLMQGLGLVLLGERTVKQLYPLVVHVPLVLILILFMKKSVGVAIVSTCTAYLCCQPPRWGRIAVEALTQSTLAAELVYILLMPVMYYLLRRFFVAAAYNTMTSSTAALLLFGSLPVTYYIFDYATTIYSDALYSGIQALNEFLPTVLITFYVLFLPAFHLQSQRRADAEMQRSMLEAELEQSQSEMDSLHRLETQTAVYQHDMRHHLNMLDGLLSAGRPDEATAYIKNVQADIEAITPRRFCENHLVNLLCSLLHRQSPAAGHRADRGCLTAQRCSHFGHGAVLPAEQRSGKRPARRGGPARRPEADLPVLRCAAEQASHRDTQSLRRTDSHAGRSACQ